jgi:dihydroorotase/N-acyl-D-amino-acid deacylase
MTLPSEFVLSGGTVVDGTGSDGFEADVVVSGGRVRVVPPGSSAGVLSVDVDGLVVAPGFIDTHSHADAESLLGDEQVHASRIVQGVTTEVVGNCGLSAFPVDGAGDLARQFMTIVFGPHVATYPTLDAFATDVESAGLASNIAPLVGHGTLRAVTLGYENRAPTEDELGRMRGALTDALAAGAFGLSSGLCYTPATYAQPAEVQALAAVVADFGGVYATHIRNETDRTVESLMEALDVARATGVDLHISHLKSAGRPQWGTSPAILSLLEQASGDGISVSADVYPYTAASTSLHSLLPPWTAEGGMDVLTASLSDPHWRDRVHDGLRNGVPGWQNLGSAAGWDNVFLATASARPEWEGMSIASLAADGDRPVDTIARVLTENTGKVVVVIEAMQHEDMVAFLTWPDTMVGSDGIPLPGKPHPRLTGTFPRVVGRFREAIGSLESAVHRMTGASASRFHISDRGIIADGKVADLVVFDPTTIADRSTYADPWARPEGVAHVIVAGKAAVWDAEPVNGSLGAVLRRAGRDV